MKKTNLHSNSSLLLHIQMLKITAPVILYTLVSMFSLSAQTPREDSGADGLPIKHLKIGDTIPQALWDLKLNIIGHPSGAKETTLRDFYTKKLIILDFWATYCSSCIAAFPALYKLEREMNEKIKIVSISHQDAAAVQKFITKSIFLKENHLDKFFYSVVNDKILTRYFEKDAIPFNVVIDQKGIVRALTTPAELTADRLSLMIADQNARPILPKKTIIDSPLLTNPTVKEGNFYSGILPYDPTLPAPVVKKVDSLRQIKHFVYPNLGLKRLFAYCIQYQSPRKGNINTIPSRCIIEADPQSEEFLSIFDPNGKYTKVTYEAVAPIHAPDSIIFAKMNMDLDVMTGMKASYQKRMIPCLVMTILSQKLLPINVSGSAYPTLVLNGVLEGDGTGDGRFEQSVQLNNNQSMNFMRNYSVKDMLYAFNQTLGANIPFMIDETNFQGKLDLRLPQQLDDLLSLQSLFAKQGLKLSLEQRELDVFVLSSGKFKFHDASMMLTSNGYVYMKRKEETE